MYLSFKRIADIFFAILSIIILSPFLIFTMLVLKIKKVNPIVYSQKRSGRKDIPFMIYKFKTMEGDKSLNKFCHFLRKTGLDELPQLVNIIKGEMSFVGPRPWILEYSLYFNKKQKKRLEVLPGLTGLAQVSDVKDVFDKIDKDCYYVQNMSVFLDLKIIFRTVKYLFTNKKIDYISIEEEIEMLKNQNDD